MTRLEQTKHVLEILLLLVFLLLAIRLWRTHGTEHALAMLTNKP